MAKRLTERQIFLGEIYRFILQRAAELRRRKAEKLSIINAQGENI